MKRKQNCRWIWLLSEGSDRNKYCQCAVEKTIRKQKAAIGGKRMGMSLDEMKNVDVRTVDRDSLVDINTIVIDESLSKEERAAEFLRQIKNPYCFRVGKVVVKNVYSDDGVSLEERFEQFARTL